MDLNIKHDNQPAAVITLPAAGDNIDCEEDEEALLVTIDEMRLHWETPEHVAASFFMQA